MNKYKKNFKNKVFTGINITPLTDIALTLLIIFMVAAPMIIQSHIEVSLPKVEQGTDNSIVTGFLTIIIDKFGEIYIDNKNFSLKNLQLYLQDYKDQHQEVSIIINGDKIVSYDSVIRVLDIVKNLGITRISLGIEVNKY
ncbi:MAG: biopolymer transporter ExbD [Elusimicrobiota bacterium]|jgi:biopolymer transport protein ExbD|nr:biopolymer transporter ExbD [Elusimicrobiota bacterium]